MNTIHSTWQRIETWLRIHMPDIWQHLPSGALETEIRQAEMAIGLTLPEDFKASYLLHNGGYLILLASEMNIFSLDDLVATWQMFQQLAEEETWTDAGPPYYVGNSLEGSNFEAIQPVWWDTHWIPFGRDSAGNCCCIDFNPTQEGLPGQIIDWDHEVGPSRVLAHSFSEVLSTFASDLEAGAYVIDVTEGFTHRSKR
jgi:cell wall assembly regulator SMI1